MKSVSSFSSIDDEVIDYVKEYKYLYKHNFFTGPDIFVK